MSDDADKRRGLRIVVEEGEVLAPIEPESENAAQGRRRAPPPAGGLPDRCPVEPLGTQNGTYYYLDELGQFIELSAEKHGRLGLKSLWGTKIDELRKAFPRYGAGGMVNGTDNEAASDAHMSACAGRGIFDPFERVRGRGGWCAASGDLILHCGDRVFDGRQWRKPGTIGRHVYPAGSAILCPASERQSGGDEGPGEELLALFNSWNWRRSEIDALILLGWCCAAFVGGALDWRPTAWVTGDRSTGKSTLQKAIARLYEGALVSVADASAAGIWQRLGFATLPVAFDELESESDNRRTQEVIKLARLAASGALMLRGGADHNATQFVARSCFLFSSILVPPLLAQDRSRIAILELGTLTPGAAVPDVGEERMAALGAAILRRLLDGWSRYPATLALYRDALMAEGHGARGADVFGTMLALADIARFDDMTTSAVAKSWALKLAPASLAEMDDDASDQERCLQHILTQSLPLDATVNRRSVGDWIARAAGRLPIEADPDEPRAQYVEEAARVLQRYGLKVIDGDARWNGERWFAVANNHAELAKLFAGTHWNGRSGAAGASVQSLRRLPGARPSGIAVYFGGPTSKATLVPLDLVLAPESETARPRATTAPRFAFPQRERGDE